MPFTHAFSTTTATATATTAKEKTFLVFSLAFDHSNLTLTFLDSEKGRIVSLLHSLKLQQACRVDQNMHNLIANSHRHQCYKTFFENIINVPITLT